jgi:hypothetical protein
MVDFIGDANACPVCAEPESGDVVRPAHCALCGWELRSVHRLGVAGAAQRAIFDGQLAEACRAYDLRAVAAAAVYAGPAYADAYLRLARHVRGGAPDGDVPAPPPDRRVTVTMPVLTERMRGADLADGFLFVEVGAAALTVWHADGGVGDPPIVSSQRWHEICPALSGYRQVQLFQLAGGLGAGRVSRAVWRDAVAGAVATIAATLTRPVVLVDGPDGLVLLHDVVAAVRDRIDVVATIPAQPDARALGLLAQHLMSGIARLEGYDVLVARYGHAGTGLRLDRRPVFPPAQLAAGQARETTVVVHGPPGGGDTVVPIVRHDADTTGPAAAVLVLPLAAGERAELVVRQTGPGAIEVGHPGGRRDDSVWAGAGDLARYGRPGQLDVVITVELGEPADGPGVVRERVLTARRLLDQIAHAHADARIAVIGYRDHDLSRGGVKLLTGPLGPVADATGQLLGMSPTAASYDFVAPLEEALAAAGDLAWRGPAQKILIMLAGRPPHPPEESQYLLRCPLGVRLPEAVATLPAGLTSLAVLTGPAADPLTRAGKAARTWAEQAWADLTPRTPLMTAQQVHDVLDELLAAAGPVNLKVAAG